MPSAKQRVRHPAVSDIALALATRRSDPVSKVELSLNAKGDVQISVDVSDTDPRKAADVAAVIFTDLRTKFPRVERPEPPKKPDPDEMSESRIAASKGKKK